MEQSLDRYEKFLSLKQIYPKEFLVPCYDIDLMWHTHQVHPVTYKVDCIHNLKKNLPHDDTDQDRDKESKLAKSYEQTEQLWLAANYGQYSKSGAMYRGMAPDAIGLLPSRNYKDFGSRKLMKMTLESVTFGPIAWQ